MSAIQTNFTPTNVNIGNIGNVGGSKSSVSSEPEVLNKSEFESQAGHKPHGQLARQAAVAGAIRAAALRASQQAQQRQRLNSTKINQQDQMTGIQSTNRLEKSEQKEPVENAFDEYCSLQEEIGKKRAEDPQADCSELENKQDALLEQHGDELRSALINGEELEQTYNILSASDSNKVAADASLNSLLNTTDADNKQVPKKPVEIYKELVAKCNGKPEAVLSAMNQVSSANGARLRARPEGPKAMMQMKAANTLSLVRSVDSIAGELRKELSEIGYPADSLGTQSDLTMKLLDVSSSKSASKFASSVFSEK